MSERDVRTIRLIGQSAFDILKQSKVAVFGVGGVGGPAAEALARSGIGAIDLIDRDELASKLIPVKDAQSGIGQTFMEWLIALIKEKPPTIIKAEGLHDKT